MLLEQKKYMGQVIEVNYKQLGRDLILDLNRTISGQEGISFNNISEASLDKTFSGEMALSLFQNFDDIVSIHILSNSVTISFERNIRNVCFVEKEHDRSHNSQQSRMAGHNP